MTKHNEIAIEIAKNKADEIIAKKELDDAKKRIIAELENGMGEEIKQINVYELNMPIKYRKPFKIKLKEFWSKINKILG